MGSEPFVVVAITNVLVGLYGAIKQFSTSAGVFGWDFLLALFNAIAPSHSPHRVVPQGYAGASGQWPKYYPPGPDDSRCSCPALNTLANHGAFTTFINVIQHDVHFLFRHFTT